MIIKTAIIGCGDVVSSYGAETSAHPLNHIDALNDNKNFDIVGISDNDARKLALIQDKFQIKNAYQSYKDLALNHDIDLMVVALPTELHFEAIDFLIKQNIKNIFCEKPFTKSLDEITKISDSIDNQIFFINYFRRWNPEIEKEVKKIHSGAYGDLVIGNCYYTKDLYTNASHILHILNWIFGYPTEIKTRNCKRIEKFFFSDFSLTFNNSVIDINHVKNVDYVFIEVDLIFTKGRIRITQRGQNLSVGKIVKDNNYGFNIIAEKEIITSWDDCFRNAYKNIQECIIEKNVNKCDINDALKVHKILEEVKHGR